MKISAKAMISNSEMIKNYKACRNLAENLGKVFILRNNQPDAVLFSIAEYERLSEIIEYLESFDDADIARFIDTMLKEERKKS